MTPDEARALVDATFTAWWASLSDSVRIMMPRAEIEGLRLLLADSVSRAAARSSRTPTAPAPAEPPAAAAAERPGDAPGWIARLRRLSAIWPSESGV